LIILLPKCAHCCFCRFKLGRLIRFSSLFLEVELFIIRIEDDRDRINKIEIKFRIIFIKLRPAVIKRKFNIFSSDNNFIVIRIGFDNLNIIILRFRMYDVIHNKFHYEI
jgi:hypothetical protein